MRVGSEFDVRQLEEVQELADVVADLSAVAHRHLTVDRVSVPTADAFSDHVSGVDQIGHDPLGGSFGDADALRDVAETDVAVTSDAEEHLRVVREERPGLSCRT